MIKAADLRLGNTLIDFMEQPIAVTCQVIQMFIDEGVGYGYPLPTAYPLSEQLLKQIGFKRQYVDFGERGKGWYLVKDYWYLCHFYGENTFAVMLLEVGSILNTLPETITTLHEFQNLYYAVSKKELEINF